MNRLTLAVVTAVITAITTLVVLWVIIAVTGGSFVEALTQPRFWVVEGVTIVLVSLAVLAPDEDARSQPRPPLVRVAARAGWTVAGAITVGVLLAVATQTPVFEVLSNMAFLIPAGVAVLVAILEAWPDDASD
jgi:hypothetical protein